MNQTCRTLLEKQGRAHKWCTPMDPAYGQAKAGRPAQTYIQQLCEDTGCSSEDLPEAMNDREKWRERDRDIRASGTTWWDVCVVYLCMFVFFFFFFFFIIHVKAHAVPCQPGVISFCSSRWHYYYQAAFANGQCIKRTVCMCIDGVADHVGNTKP